MRCPDCGREMACRRGEHEYVESGLAHVYLGNVEIWTCPCGGEVVGIPHVPELNDLIARRLVNQAPALTGPEIRFLRKRLALPAKAFAERLGVDPATLSRWENGKQAPDRSLDRLIRLFFLADRGLPAGELANKLAGIGVAAAPPEPMHIPRELWMKEDPGDPGCQP